MKGFYTDRLAGWTGASGIAFILAIFPSPQARAAEAATDANHDTVVWISMDGTRADYLDRAPLPFLHRMMSEGVSTRRSRPTFPSITFPSHCSQATGVGADEHGIPGNGFYDSATRQRYQFPADASLLQAEPIWLTASRQGVRTAVFDWPVSQQEAAPVHAAYFDAKFDEMTDAQRLGNLLEPWRKEGTPGTPASPVRLLMGYVEGTDPVGHKFGPDAPEIAAEMTRLDQELGDFQAAALALWKAQGTGGHIYFLFTTDHGMSKVEKVVDFDKLTGLPHAQHEINLAFTGNTGSIFFDGIADPGQRQTKLEEMLAKLKPLSFARVFRREELPPAWHYAHPTRVGDLVIVLAKGYTFGKLQAEAVTDIAQAGSPKGMHGYPIDDDPEMYGPLILWRYPDAFKGEELGEVDWSQIHPTVAKLLGIKPAGTAHGLPLTLP